MGENTLVNKRFDAPLLSGLQRWADLPKGPCWLLSPYLQDWQRKCVENLRVAGGVNDDVVWLLSSGTQSVDSVKAIGLTHSAILNSAASVNRHLRASAEDHWLVTLPTYHVGGLAILARAYLSGARHSFLQPAKWDAMRFHETAVERAITLCSLVPTQVYDLVQLGKRAPDRLRAIVVGGGALDSHLYLRARELGWPLLPSYGLTETSSQVATAALSSLGGRGRRSGSRAPVSAMPDLKVLDHVEFDLMSDGRVRIKATSLCSFVATANKAGQITLMPAVGREGWFETEDLGEWRDGLFRALGRRDSTVKVLGALVSLPQMESDFRALLNYESLFKIEVAVLPVGSPREGKVLFLLTDAPFSLQRMQRLMEKYNHSVPRPQRFSGLVWVPRIPTGDLGKIKRAEIAVRLGL